MKKDWFYLRNAKTGEYLVCKMDVLTGMNMFGFGEKVTKFSEEDIKRLGFQKDIEDGIIVKEAI